MATIHTWVIMPTLNEAPTVIRLIPELLALAPDVGILGIDDHSCDGTAAIWNRWHERCGGRVQVIHRPGPLGLGTAYRTAFQHPMLHRAAWVLQMDADGSHQISDVRALLGQRGMPGDLWIGSRWIPGGHTPHWSLTRRLLSRGGSWYTRQIIHTDLHDLTSGFKLWRGTLVRQMPWESCAVTGYAFQIAATVWAEALGARIDEVPITFVPRQAGHSKLSGAILREALGTPWRVRRAIRIHQAYFRAMDALSVARKD